MIKHVVLMKFRSGVAEDRVAELAAGLGSLPGKIEEIREYSFGRDVLGSERSFDFGLVSAFDDQAALERYRVHPAHVEVLATVRAMCEATCVVDFEC